MRLALSALAAALLVAPAAGCGDKQATTSAAATHPTVLPTQSRWAKRVDVVYHGAAPPPLFRVGRSVVVTGTYMHGSLQGTDIVTKCPSKYTSSAS